MTSLLLTALIALGAPGAAASPGPAQVEAPAPGPTPTKSPLPDGGALWPGQRVAADADDTLPTTALTDAERKKAADAALERLDDQERSWTAQLVRTLLSLLVVVGLIYLIFKVAVPRLMGVSLPGKAGKGLRVVERTQLDARHAVMLIEVDKHRFLVGTGEQGVQLLADLNRSGAGKSDFQTALARAAADEDPHAKG